LDLVLADPVVLLAVENGHEHVEVREQLAQRARRLELDGEVGAVAPLGEGFVEGVALGAHLVAERLEEAAKERLAPAARKHDDARDEWERRLDEVGALLAAAAERAA